MTARDKAIALVRSFSKQMPPKVIPTASTKSGELSCNIDLFANIPRAKQCALIAVDEMEKTLLMVYNGVDNIPHLVTAYKSEKDYNDNVKNIRDVLKHDLAKEIMWLSDVKTEIEKL